MENLNNVIEIKIHYEGQEIVFQSELNKTCENIVNKISDIIGINKSSLSLLYNGNLLLPDKKKLFEIINSMSKKSRSMVILVYNNISFSDNTYKYIKNNDEITIILIKEMEKYYI